jgi:hypothetical protein
MSEKWTVNERFTVMGPDEPARAAVAKAEGRQST